MNSNIKWKNKRGIHELNTDFFKISVMNIHVNYPGQWIMQCQPFYYNYKLEVDTESGAKLLSIKLVYRKLESLLRQLNEVFPGLGDAI